MTCKNSAATTGVSVYSSDDETSASGSSCKTFKRVGFAGDLRLDRYNVPRTVVAPTLPGLGRLDFDTVQQRSGGTMRRSAWVCGGVSLDFAESVAKNAATRDTLLVA